MHFYYISRIEFCRSIEEEMGEISSMTRISSNSTTFAEYKILWICSSKLNFTSMSELPTCL